jgi:outer membrane lipopolysaccharide assembly protein LptE/RlpB
VILQGISVSAASVREDRRGLQRFWPLVVNGGKPQPKEYSPQRHGDTEENNVKTRGHRGGGGVILRDVSVSAASVREDRRGLRRFWPLVVHGRQFRLQAVIASAVLAAGCGYHLGGQGDLIPKDVKTIAIPAFTNATMQYQVATVLTDNVVREFHARTHYTIVTDKTHADAVLTGTVVNFAVLGGITTDPVTSRATSSQIILTVQFSLTDRRTGKVIYQRSGYEFRNRYEISTSLPAYFDESNPAIKRVSEDAARALVTSILEAF